MESYKFIIYHKHIILSEVLLNNSQKDFTLIFKWAGIKYKIMQNYQGIFQKGRACMSHEWKGYILINLGQFEYEIPETPCKFKSFGVWKCKKNQKEYCVRVAYAITVWNKRWLHTFLIPHFSAVELNAGIHCFFPVLWLVSRLR